MLRPLTRTEFLATFKQPMRDSSGPLLPVLKDYVNQCRREIDLLAGEVALEIQHVFENGDRSFLHIPFYFGRPNVYLAIVVDAHQETIHGHFILDLNAEYGLDQDV